MIVLQRQSCPLLSYPQRFFLPMATDKVRLFSYRQRQHWKPARSPRIMRRRCAGLGAERVGTTVVRRKAIRSRCRRNKARLALAAVPISAFFMLAALMMPHG